MKTREEERKEIEQDLLPPAADAAAHEETSKVLDDLFLEKARRDLADFDLEVFKK